MRSFESSFASLFSPHDGAPTIERIEIPLVQRDYAQGRADSSVAEIRADFLEALFGAVTIGPAISLDFVYGDISHGTLRPLDGQQRLTTLFLLHWYLGFRADALHDNQPWFSFAYATRPSARRFCERLVAHPPAPNTERPADWVRDQSWFLYVWKHDPTIQSMLVMIKAMDARFGAIDIPAAWDRLTDPEAPAISFHLLPIDEIGAGDELYIKMNSRGKPLTPFENFKARFEQLLARTGRADELANKIDGVWADILWPLRGVDDIVDSEFMRYFQYITQICEWRQGRSEYGRLWPRAEAIFSPHRDHSEESLDFLFDAFDTWVDASIDGEFSGLLASAARPHEPGKVVIFGPEFDPRLFRLCCKSYGQRRFGLPESLLLYTFLIHRIHATEDFARRLRIVRNLIEASTNELRADNMRNLLSDTARVIIDGALDNLDGFNQAQVEDERLKREFLSRHPDLQSAVFELEDLGVLRGSLGAFELDRDVFVDRARVFRHLMLNKQSWSALTGALVATGEYARPRNKRSLQFGSPDNEGSWRDLLTGTSRRNLAAVRAVLGEVLDRVASDLDHVGARLDDISREWCDSQHQYNWRYYMARYPAMREGKSGIYYGQDGRMGFSLCMLDKTQLNSYYRDPFLHAAWKESGVGPAARDPWFMGYETAPRWLQLVASGTRMRYTNDGIQLSPPTEDDASASFDEVCGRLGVSAGKLRPRSESRGRDMYDLEDRIQMGAALLRELVAAKL
jgi:hypothetical protein